MLNNMGGNASRNTDASASAAPAAASDAANKKNATSSVTMQSFKSDPAGFVTRYKYALHIQQQHKAGRTLNKKDRGNLMGTLSLLYAAEESAARKKLSEDKDKKKIEAAQSHASHSSPAALSASLAPLKLPDECNVCYSRFNTIPPVDDDADPLCFRVRMTLCGHASICSDCFSQYISSRITSDDVLPFIPCPEAGCKLPLCQRDLVCETASVASSLAIEAEFNHEQEIIAKRNQKAVEAFKTINASSVLDAEIPTNNSSKNHRKGKKKDKSKKKAQQQQSASSSSSTASEGDDDSPVSEHATSCTAELSSSSSSSSCSSASPVPSAPSLLTETATYVIPTPQLLQLVLLHMSKLLLRCEEWLPCGTFPLPVKEKKKQNADDGEDDDEEEKEAEESKKDDEPASDKKDGEPAVPTCLGGFLLLPPLFTRYSSKPKIRKCEYCTCLQTVKPKNAQDVAGHAADPELKKLVDEGILRPCPSCNALNGKDHGMCNVIQCVSCQVYWNWRTRETGDNPARMKEKARMNGSLWEAGELAYQMNLQHNDPEAFKDLLRKNGIAFNPNYVRGGS